jgi:hypothetical protein
MLLVARDECKLTNMRVKIGQRKLEGSYAAVFEERQAALVFGFEVVEGNAAKV